MEITLYELIVISTYELFMVFFVCGLFIIFNHFTPGRAIKQVKCKRLLRVKESEKCIIDAREQCKRRTFQQIRKI